MARTAPARKPTVLYGSPTPRLAPPTPARADVAGFRATAQALGITLMPWQETAARYLTATGPSGLLYREVCILVARQNGKTTLMKPYIIRGLRAGKNITHLAQNRNLPREMFGLIADALSGEPELFPKRRGRVVWPRYGSGQEEILLANGGTYRIAASNRGGGRGWKNDIIIVDELREQLDHDVMAAAEPTLTMSKDPQAVYLSNMGDERSVVLTEVRERRDDDPSLAFLEWSAAPERLPGDRAGWYEANPALGHYPQVLQTLERAYLKATRSPDKMAAFQTENLCRHVPSLNPLLSEEDWLDREGRISRPNRPAMAIALDPSGRRASAALAWQNDDHWELRIDAELDGAPVDTKAFGAELQARAKALGVRQIGYDDWTDKDLARWLRNARAIGGHEFAAASDNFDRLVRGDQLVWGGPLTQRVTEDLRWLTRKAHETGAWQAVRATDEHSVTAALAAIRAVWLASRPAQPRVPFLA